MSISCSSFEGEVVIIEEFGLEEVKKYIEKEGSSDQNMHTMKSSCHKEGGAINTISHRKGSLYVL